MKLGVENKRNVVILSLLGLVAAYGIYSNFSDSSSSTSSGPAATGVAPPTIGSGSGDSDQQPAAPRARARNEEWHPVVHPKNKDEQVNPATIDPTLHLDLLAKVQAVKPAGGARNLFEFGAAKPVPTVASLGPNEPKITGPKTMGPTPLPPPPPPPPPPSAPVDPPVRAQYYGFASPSHSGRRRGFFMEKVGDNENILIKAEGEILVGRYKIIRLDAGSVTVQNMDSNRTQTLAIVEDASE